ncbi:MAG: hypothetical protein IJL52_03125 [Clostridia bacterium]|nr:hypothetical protein [Clostridia bacterium]
MTQQISLSKYDIFQAAIVWDPTVNTVAQTQAATNYELFVYDPNGVLLYFSSLLYGCAEFVRFEIQIAGTYNIVVRQQGAMPPGVSSNAIALAIQVL